MCSPSVTVKLNPPDSEPEIRHKQSYSIHHVILTIKVFNGSLQHIRFIKLTFYYQEPFFGGIKLFVLLYGSLEAVKGLDGVPSVYWFLESLNK